MMREVTDSLVCQVNFAPMFHVTACDSLLAVMTFNASSMSEDVDRLNWIPENGNSRGQFVKWHASSEDQQPWLELELFNQSNITGQEARRMYSRICCICVFL